MRFFVILRGPLGVGKTTIAHALAWSIGGEVLSVDEALELWEWDGGSERLFLDANKYVSQRARTILTVGVPIVFDGNFYWESQIQDLVARLPFPHEVFTLWAPLSVCVERDSLRSLAYGVEAAQAVYEKVTRFESGVPIDATREVPAVVNEIRSRLPVR